MGEGGEGREERFGLDLGWRASVGGSDPRTLMQREGRRKGGRKAAPWLMWLEDKLQNTFLPERGRRRKEGRGAEVGGSSSSKGRRVAFCFEDFSFLARSSKDVGGWVRGVSWCSCSNGETGIAMRALETVLEALSTLR